MILEDKGFCAGGASLPEAGSSSKDDSRRRYRRLSEKNGAEGFFFQKRGKLRIGNLNAEKVYEFGESSEKTVRNARCCERCTHEEQSV